jgi:hypothetical protein
VTESEFVCPNGHPVASLVVLDCECGAGVAYIPVAETIALRDAVRDALEIATTHSELVRLLMPLAYPKGESARESER